MSRRRVAARRPGGRPATARCGSASRASARWAATTCAILGGRDGRPARRRRRSGRGRPRRGRPPQTGAPGLRGAAGDDRRGGPRRGRHRRPDDGPRRRSPWRPSSAASRSSSRSRSRPRSTRRCGSSPRPARRGVPGPGRPRRAVQPGRPRARPAARRPAGCRRVYAIASRRAGPFPARIRDVGVTVDLATHDVDILSLDRRRAADRGSTPRPPSGSTPTHEDLLFGLLHFPSGATGMLDVNWLTPAKRRQLTVVGEEGMFELDYLTQRLTFTRATDTTQPAPDRRLRADVRGRGRRAAGRDRPSRSPPSSTPSSRVVRDGGRPVVDAEDGLWAVAIATALLDRGRRRARRRPDRRCPRGSPRMTIVARPTVRAEPARRLDRAAVARLPPRAGRPSVAPWIGEPGTAGTVAVVGAGKMGLPLAAQFAVHGWYVIAVDVAASASSTRSTPGSRTSAEEPGLAELVARRPRGRPPPGDDRRRRGGARGRRRRPDRAGHARRRAAARLPLHGRGGRVDRARRPRRLARHLRDDAAGRRHPRTGSRRGSSRPSRADRRPRTSSSPSRRSGSTAAPRSRNLATYPKLVGGLGPASDRPRRRVLRRRSSTPRSSR